jgi:hypothetical protein
MAGQIEPDNVVENTSDSLDSEMPQVFVVKGLTWLGGRDSNPDNVVQRAVNALRSMSFRSCLFDSSTLSLQ